MKEGQYDLDDEMRQRARNTDPDTSAKWADRVQDRRIDAEILATLRGIQPATEADVSRVVIAKLGVDRTSISPRFAPLRRAKLIERAGRADHAYLYRLYTGEGKAEPEQRRGSSFYARIESAARTGKGVRLTPAEVKEIARIVTT